MSEKQSVSIRRDGVVLDRIFVRGLVLPVAIGVYDEEQGIATQAWSPSMP